MEIHWLTKQGAQSLTLLLLSSTQDARAKPLSYPLVPTNHHHLLLVVANGSHIVHQIEADLGSAVICCRILFHHVEHKHLGLAGHLVGKRHRRQPDQVIP